MDGDCYLLERLVQARLSDLRADAARRAVLASLGRPRGRTALGLGLIRIGRWLLGAQRPARRGAGAPVVP